MPEMSTVLVVEDKAEARRPMAKLLRQEGYNVLTASDAYGMAAAIRNERPNLVLLDVGIPPVDGLTMLALVREESPQNHFPVILVTGYSDEQTCARAQQLGIKEHLVKSKFTPDELLAAVRKHMGTPTPAS